MTAFVLISTITSHIWFWEIRWPLVAYWGTHEACQAALDSQAAVHGDDLVGACYATGVRQNG